MKDGILKDADALQLGADLVALLLPHKRPFVMVDTIEAYSRTPEPTLRAVRHISMNEPVFEGHFPGLHLWPGVYTIEGMGQSCNLLRIIAELQDGWEAMGAEAGDVLESLKNLSRGYRLHPGYRPDASTKLVEVLQTKLAQPTARMGMSTAVRVKLQRPVFAGDRLVYTVTQTHTFGTMVRFDVRAEVANQVVALGTMDAVREELHLPHLSAPS